MMRTHSTRKHEYSGLDTVAQRQQQRGRADVPALRAGQQEASPNRGRVNAAERRHDEFSPAVFASAGHGQSPPRSETATATASARSAGARRHHTTTLHDARVAQGCSQRQPESCSEPASVVVACCVQGFLRLRPLPLPGRPAARCGRCGGVRTQSRRRGEGTRYLSVGRGCGTRLASCSTCRPPAPRTSFAGRARGAERHSSMMIVSSTTRVARQGGAHHGAGTQGSGRAAGSHAWQSCFIPIRSSLGSCLERARARIGGGSAGLVIMGRDLKPLDNRGADG